MTKGLFGTSGIRRKVSELDSEFVVSLGKSLGTFSKDKAIAIGRDTRNSSPRLESEFMSGLISTGHDVVKLGIVPTPTVGIAAMDYGNGVMITASHNPPEYNGFKFWGRNGAYTPKQENEIEKILYSENFRTGNGKEIKGQDYIEKHINLILKNVGKVNRKVKIFLDCANGSGSVLTPKLLEIIGCDVISINKEVDGNFPHGLEPTAENLKEICKMVKESGADIGIVHDGDADRSAAIDRDGKLIDWDSLLAVLAYGKDKVVTTVDASMRIEDVCKKVIRTPVGDVAVANAIVRENADFGGEPSGSYIFPEVHLFPDGPLTAAVIAKMVSEGRFYEILKRIKVYPTERLKIPCNENSKEIIMENINTKLKEFRSSEAKPRIKNKIKSEEFDVDYTDGIRITMEKGWILIRPSGTEPYIRITAEGIDKKSLDKIVKMGREWVDTAIINK